MELHTLPGPVEPCVTLGAQVVSTPSSAPPGVSWCRWLCPRQCVMCGVSAPRVMFPGRPLSSQVWYHLMATLTICRDTDLNKQRYSTCTLAFVFRWGVKEPLQICRPLNVFIFFKSAVTIIKDTVCHKNGLFAHSLWSLGLFTPTCQLTCLSAAPVGELRSN